MQAAKPPENKPAINPENLGRVGAIDCNDQNIAIKIGIDSDAINKEHTRHVLPSSSSGIECAEGCRALQTAINQIAMTGDPTQSTYFELVLPGFAALTVITAPTRHNVKAKVNFNQNSGRVISCNKSAWIPSANCIMKKDSSPPSSTDPTSLSQKGIACALSGSRDKR